MAKKPFKPHPATLQQIQDKKDEIEYRKRQLEKFREEDKRKNLKKFFRVFVWLIPLVNFFLD